MEKSLKSKNAIKQLPTSLLLETQGQRSPRSDDKNKKRRSAIQWIQLKPIDDLSQEEFNAHEWTRAQVSEYLCRSSEGFSFNTIYCKLLTRQRLSSKKIKAGQNVLFREIKEWIRQPVFSKISHKDTMAKISRKLLLTHHVLQPSSAICKSSFNYRSKNNNEEEDVESLQRKVIRKTHATAPSQDLNRGRVELISRNLEAVHLQEGQLISQDFASFLHFYEIFYEQRGMALEYNWKIFENYCKKDDKFNKDTWFRIRPFLRWQIRLYDALTQKESFKMTETGVKLIEKETFILNPSTSLADKILKRTIEEIIKFSQPKREKNSLKPDFVAIDTFPPHEKQTNKDDHDNNDKNIQSGNEGDTKGQLFKENLMREYNGITMEEYLKSKEWLQIFNKNKDERTIFEEIKVICQSRRCDMEVALIQITDYKKNSLDAFMASGDEDNRQDCKNFVKALLTEKEIENQNQ